MTPAISRPAGYGPEWNKTLEQTGWWHSFELPDGTQIQGVCSVEGLKLRISQFPIPEDLRGKRVLDIGAWDGWFSFEMERRGAQVLAIDCWDNPRFHEMREMLHSSVEYRVMDVMDISPETIGRFDIVLFMGVLYHLKHPLLALEKVCAVATEFAAVDSYILIDDLDPNAKPVLEFYETNEFEGQLDNWVAPNLACLLAMCRTAGFARVELQQVLQYGACVACYRQWPADAAAGVTAPEILKAIHAINGGINFQSSKDEYVICYFRSPETALTVHNLQPQIGPYGVRPIGVAHLGADMWQVNFKVPPGLEAGWHSITLRTKLGPASNATRMALDIALPALQPVIEGVHDAVGWAKNELNLDSGTALAVWISGLPANADMSNLKVALGNELCKVLTIEPGTEQQSRQVNVVVPARTAPGSASLTARLGDYAPSAPVIIEIKRG